VTISYQDLIKINAAREPLPEVEVTAATAFSEFFISATAPTSAAEGSMWFNIDSQDSKLYLRYDNNWIGIQ
jgi:hypothetical protein